MPQLIQQSPLTGGMSYWGIQNYFDALKDDFDYIEYFPFGDEYFKEANLIINGIGQRDIAKQPQMKWFERQRQEVPFTTSGSASIASGVYTVTLDANEVDTTTGYSWPAATEVWRQATTGYLYQITSKPASNTLVLRPFDSTVTATIPSGAKFFYVGNTQVEGSSPIQSKFMFDTLYTTYLQTIRHDYKTTSEAMYNQLWYDEDQAGKAIPFSNTRDVQYFQREHLIALTNTFLAGDVANNLATSTSFQTTPGLIPTIFDRGQVQDTGGDLDETAFYAMEAKLTTQDGSVKDYMVWTTGETSKQIEQNFLAYNANANIQVNKVDMTKSFWGDGQMSDKMRTTYSFNTLVINNKNFGLVRMGIFDNPQTFGVTGSTWKQYAVVLPVAAGAGVDDGFGNMGKYIRLAHKPDAFMNMYPTGGRAPANRTGIWEMNMHCVTEVAFKFIAANKMGIFYDAP
jgi:hypothetical protein